MVSAPEDRAYGGKRSMSSSGFFFQAEDGIRDWSVTGVQTCALPISPPCRDCTPAGAAGRILSASGGEIGRASCRERVEIWVEAVLLERKNENIERRNIWNMERTQVHRATAAAWRGATVRAPTDARDRRLRMCPPYGR